MYFRDFSAVFCTELVAACLQYAKVFYYDEETGEHRRHYHTTKEGELETGRSYDGVIPDYPEVVANNVIPRVRSSINDDDIYYTIIHILYYYTCILLLYYLLYCDIYYTTIHIILLYT